MLIWRQNELPVLAWLIMGFACLSMVHGQDRAAVPNSKACAEASQVIDEAFKDERAGNDPTGRLELARKLVQAASSGRDPDAIRYVEFCRARKLASGVDLETALAISDQLSKSFAVDPFQARLDVLSNSAAAKPTIAIVESVISWSADALSDGKLEIARRLASAASALGAKLNDPVLVGDVHDWLRQIENAEKLARIIDTLRARLKGNPDDADAAVELGRILCRRGSMAEGIDFLRSSHDARVRAAVAAEQANPSTPAQIISAADAWWEVQTVRTFPMGAARRRAVGWYAEVLPQLDGIYKARIELRLEEAARHDQAAVEGPLGKWMTLTYGGVRWEPSKASVSCEHELSSIRLTDRGAAKTYFVNPRVITGDFAFVMTARGSCVIGLLSADRTDRSIFCNTPKDDRWHEYRLQRQGPTVRAFADGREIEVKFYNADPRLVGALGLILEPGKILDVRTISLR